MVCDFAIWVKAQSRDWSRQRWNSSRRLGPKSKGSSELMLHGLGMEGPIPARPGDDSRMSWERVKMKPSMIIGRLRSKSSGMLLTAAVRVPRIVQIPRFGLLFWRILPGLLPASEVVHFFYMPSSSNLWLRNSGGSHGCSFGSLPRTAEV